MKKRNRIVSLLVCLTLLSGLMIAPAQAADGLTVKGSQFTFYPQDVGFNIKHNDGAYTGFGSYKTYLTQDGGQTLQTVRYQEGPFALQNSLTVEMNPQMVYNDQYVKINYTVKNNGSTVQSFQLATSVLVCFRWNNYTWMVGLPGGGRGIVMNDKNYTLNLLAPSCDTVWYGHDFQRAANIFNNNDNNTVKTPYQCNSMSWSWDKTVKPGQSWSSYVLIGLGDLPAPTDAPNIPNLNSKELLAGGTVAVSGTAKAGDTVYLTVDGKEYSAVADGGNFSVNVSLPADYEGDTAQVTYWAVSPEGGVSQMREATLQVLHPAAVALSPTSTTVMEEQSLDEAWYQSFISSSSGTVSRNKNVDTTKLGTQTITYTAKLSGFPDATANLSVNVLPLPAQLTQTTTSQSGKNYNLSAKMAHTGGLTYTETGFVYGSFQNPSLGFCDGSVKTSTAVNAKNGALSATATGLLDGVTYYARAYAKTADGTVVYGPQSGGFGLGVPSYGTFHVKNNGNNTFTIYRDGGSGGTQKVYYRTVNGSAVGSMNDNQHHFRHTDGVLTFNEGETSKIVTVTEHGANAEYSGVTTKYSNADRTYQMEINRVEGGAIIGTRFAERNMGHDAGYTVRKSLYTTENERSVTVNNDNKWVSDSTPWRWHRVYFKNDRGYNAANGNKNFNVQRTMNVGSTNENAYLQATAEGYSYKIKVSMTEETNGYQNIWLSNHQPDSLEGKDEDAHGDNSSINLDFVSFGHAFYTARWEANYQGKGSATGTFPSGSGLRVGQGGGKENYLYRADGSRVSGDWVTFNKDETAHAWFAATGNGDILWYVTSCTDYVKLRDTTEPHLIDVAYMARNESTTTYLPGDPITISLIFDEIVDSANSTAAGLKVDESYVTVDGWNTPFYYKGGADTNVLYFTAITPEEAPTGSGNLHVTNINCAGQIKDMAGNACKGGTASSTAPIGTAAVPTVTVGAISNSSGTLTSAITASNADKLEYVWTTTPAAEGKAPTYGWKSLNNKAGETVTTRQGAGTWYLYARATNADGRTAIDKKSVTIPASGSGALVVPDLAVSANNTAWAKTRTITVTKTPSDATVTCTAKPAGATVTPSGGNFVVDRNGSYTFKLQSGSETVFRTVSVSKLDLTAPTVSVDTLDSSKTYVEPVTLTVNVADSESGLNGAPTGTWNKSGGGSQATFTKVSDGVYASTCPVGTSGVETWTLTVNARDTVGNTGSMTSQAYKMDYRVPTIAVNRQSQSSKGDVYKYSVTQGGSPIVFIQLPDGTLTTAATGEVTLPEPGTYYIFASDEAGHVVRSAPMTVTGAVDGLAPVVRLYADTEWTNQDLTVEVGVSEKGSKPTAAVQGGTAFTLTASTQPGMAGYYEGSFTVGTNGDYSVTATDQNGNVGTAEINISNIDKTGPTITEPTGNPTAWTQNNATIAFTVSDTQSGMKTVTVKKGADNVAVTNTNGSCSFTAAENGEYTITATDNVGNESTKTVSVTKIDKAEPTLSISGGETAAESLELTVTADAPGGSGTTTTVRKDGGAAQTVTDGKYTVTAAGQYVFTAATGTGKTKSQTVNVYNVNFAETGDSTVPSQIVVSGGKVTEPTVSKEDYTLSGWKSGTSAWNFDSSTVSGDTTLTAKWFVAPTVNTLTYNGTAQTLVTAGETTAGELQYSLSENDGYSTAIPTGTNAGTYKVYYKIVEAGQSNAVKTVEVTIARKPITGVVTVSGTPTMAQTLTATYAKGEDQGETVAYQWYRDEAAIEGATESTYTIVAVDVGKTIKVVVSGTGNYSGEVEAAAGGETGQATPSVTTWPTAGAITYGQTLANSALTDGEASVAGAFAWKDGTIKPAVADSGKTEYEVVFTPSIDGYEKVSGKLTLTVNKADPVVSVTAIGNLTYNGAAQALVEGNTTGGELQYSLDGTNFAPGVPTGKDAETYTVSYKVVGGANYNDVAAQTVTVNIARKPITGAVTISGKAFVEQFLTAEYATEDSAETVGYQWYRGGTAIEGANGKTYTVVSADLDSVITVKVSGTGNYTGDVTSDATAAVGKTLPTITTWPTPTAINYGQTLADSALTGGGAGVEGTFAWEDTTIRPTVADSGKTEYKVVFIPTDTEKYSSDTKSMTVTVSKAVLIPTATAQDKTYDGTAAAIGSIALTGAVNGENPEAEAAFKFESPDAGVNKKVNVTGIALKGSWGDNYTLSTTALETTATISTKAFTDGEVVVTLGDPLTYTGEEQTQTIKSVTIGGLAVTGYTVSGNIGTDAKTYTLTVTGTGSFTGSVTKEFTIAKAGNSITNFTCGDIIHGETPKPAADASFGAIVYTYSRNADSGFAPWSSDGQTGTWYVKASVADTANYAGAEEVISFREAAQRENAPNAKINYFSETLTGLAAGDYMITPEGGMAETATVENDGAVSVREVWFGKKLSIIKKARDDSYSNSTPQSLFVPARPAAPAVHGVNETVDGRHDGSITGLTDGPAFQISDDDGVSWTDAAVTESAVPGLAPGGYLVRLKATDSSFAGVAAAVTISTGEARTYTLNLTVPTFDAVAEGYDQPEAKALTITSAGNSESTVYRVEADTAIFTIGGGGEIVPAGGSIDTWTIQPNDGLPVGVYTATVTVTYNGSAKAEAKVFFLVSEATPEIRINYAAETLTGFREDGTYTIDGVEVTPEDGNLGIKDYLGKTISVVKKGDDGTDSAPQILEIPARPVAPAAPQAVSETIKGKGDGRITGIDGTIEYKIGNGAWQSGPADLKDLPAGTTVAVRSKATGSAFASEQRTLTVGAGRTLIVTFDVQGGSPVSSLTGLSYGDAAAKPADPAKIGYTFSGWYAEPGCVNRWNFERGLTDDLALYAKWVEKTYSISGFVDEDGKPLRGATVKLVQGKTVLDQVNTGEDGAYCFENVAPGDYNVVAEQTVSGGKKTMTILVSIIDADATHQNLTMPSENVNSILEVKGEATPDVVVGGLDKEAEDNGQLGSTVTVTMTVESKDEDDADSTQVTAIKETAEEDSNLEYLAIDVKKKVETGGTVTSETPITDTQELIEIIVPFDFTGKQNVKVYRYHGAQVDTITQTANADQEKIVLGQDRVTLYVKKFSTYAIGYASVHTVTAQNDGHGTAAASPSSAVAGTEITLTAFPSSGYRFQEWQVIESNVTIEGNKFIMPNEDVTVKAIFAYTGGGSSGGGGVGGGTGRPTIKQPENGKITISPTDPKEGDQVKITVTPNDGYETDKVTVTGEDGKSVEVTRNPDGTYTFTQPKGKVTIAATLRAVHAGGYETCPRDETCPIWPYTDASATAWYHDGVHYCIENGLMHGYGNNKFGPNDTLTRGMLAQILYNKEGRPAVSGGSPFDDVAPDAWYAEAVAWGAQNGVVEGYGNGKFGPDDPITREQLATMLWRYAGSPESGEPLDRFTDGGRTSSWAAAAFRWAVEQGIVTGKGNGILDPTGTATRAEAAAMLQRFCTLS